MIINTCILSEIINIYIILYILWTDNYKCVAGKHLIEPTLTAVVCTVVWQNLISRYIGGMIPLYYNIMMIIMY